MNELLPDLSELKPINKYWQTFSETPFTKNFAELTFQDQLQIINDIVRQTMLYEETPNIGNHTKNMVGDSYTSAMVTIQYLKRLDIGTNHRNVLGKKRKFDPEDSETIHSLVLVDDENGITYQMDCTPEVGYKYGKVSSLKENKFYDTYYIVDGDIKAGIDSIKSFLYDLKNGEISYQYAFDFMTVLDNISACEELRGYVAHCYLVLKDYFPEQSLKNYCLEKSLLNNRYSSGLLLKNDNVAMNYKINLILKQVDLWREELNDLISSDRDFKRQLELAQNIVSELKKINSDYEKTVEINGKKIKLSHISPRLFWENNYNVILIKPSAFKLGVSSSIRESFLKHGNGVISESFPNVGAPSELTGIKPMRLFHPCGYMYERSMYGPGDLMLLNGDADILKAKKKQLRNELGKNVERQKIMWYDSKEMIWDSEILNLVHSTDDACEASLHYACAYPEHQLMTRFMYPNPILMKVRRK